MKRIQFKTEVNSSAGKAFDIMLGLKNKKTYEQWTSEFNPTSTYEGSWEKGSKIYFVGTDETGKRGGMVSRIAEITPEKFVSIQHYGILDGDKEVTEGPQVEKWAGGSENYSFNEQNNQTTIIVDIDVIDDYLEYFNNTYPKALNKLKEIIELA